MVLKVRAPLASIHLAGHSMGAAALGNEGALFARPAAYCDTERRRGLLVQLRSAFMARSRTTPAIVVDAAGTQAAIHTVDGRRHRLVTKFRVVHDYSFKIMGRALHRMVKPRPSLLRALAKGARRRSICRARLHWTAPACSRPKGVTRSFARLNRPPIHGGLLESPRLLFLFR
jgi:hypothetical protein